MTIVDHIEKKIGTLNQPVIISRSDPCAFFYSIDIGSPPLKSTDSSNACNRVAAFRLATASGEISPMKAACGTARNPARHI
jgi:hypothetical protein